MYFVFPSIQPHTVEEHVHRSTATCCDCQSDRNQNEVWISRKFPKCDIIELWVLSLVSRPSPTAERSGFGVLSKTCAMNVAISSEYV